MNTLQKSTKYSTWSVIAFLYFLLNVFGFFIYKPSYSSLSEYIFSDLFPIMVELFVLYFIMFKIKKSDKKGYKLTQIAFYGVLIINMLVLIFSASLSGYNKDIRNMAIEETPAFINSNLISFKANSEEPLSSILTYASTSKVISDMFGSVGEVNKCFFDNNTGFAKTEAGFYNLSNGYEFSVRSGYSVRCIGNNGFVDISLNVEKVGNAWRAYYMGLNSSNPDLNKEYYNAFIENTSN
jgi:hypothetical protein